MKKITFITIVIWASTFNLNAQTQKEKVTELFQLMKLDKMVDGMMDNMTTMMKQKSTELKSKAGADIYDEYMAFVGQETKAFTRKMINEDMVAIYIKYFTNEDIQNYIQFYSSPSGRKMIELVPTFQKELINTMMTKDMPALQAKFQKKLEELKAKK